MALGPVWNGGSPTQRWTEITGGNYYFNNKKIPWESAWKTDSNDIFSKKSLIHAPTLLANNFYLKYLRFIWLRSGQCVRPGMERFLHTHGRLVRASGEPRRRDKAFILSPTLSLDTILTREVLIDKGDLLNLFFCSFLEIEYYCTSHRFLITFELLAWFTNYDLQVSFSERL
jgi:hypothetical protein